MSKYINVQYREVDGGFFGEVNGKQFVRDTEALIITALKQAVSDELDGVNENVNVETPA